MGIVIFLSINIKFADISLLKFLCPGMNPFKILSSSTLPELMAADMLLRKKNRSRAMQAIALLERVQFI
jgi:hypothetical protein